MSEPLTIVAFGDSMTLSAYVPPDQRWPTLLESLLKEELKPRSVAVVNAGVGGNTSREGLARMEKDVLAHSPSWTLVQFGGNDATVDPARNVPFDEFDRNLEEMIRRLGAVGSRVALVTFPPVIDIWHGWCKVEPSRETFAPHGGLDGYVNEYRRRTRAMAVRHGCLLVDWYRDVRAAIEEGSAATYILPDGVHFTGAGNRAAFESVHRILRPAL